MSYGECSKCHYKWIAYSGMMPCPKCGEIMILFLHLAYGKILENHQVLINTKTGKKEGYDPCDDPNYEPPIRVYNTVDVYS